MNNIINVLLIDDDKENFDSLKNRAAKNMVSLHFKDNLEDGLKELKRNEKIDAVILDGKAYLTPGQVRGSEKENFVHEALAQIMLLEKEQDRIIPKCVLTAWYDQLKDSLEGRTEIYDKKKVSQEDILLSGLFESLREQVNQSLVLKIKIKYQDVFAVIGGRYLPDSIATKLVSIFTVVETEKIQQNDFNTIRELLEAVFIRANKIDKRFIPDNLINLKGGPNLEWCNRYLSGKVIEVKDTVPPRQLHPANPVPIVPQHIGRSIEYVKNVTSALSHRYAESWTKYSFKSSALALGEILIWFKSYIDKKYPNLI